MAHVATGIRVHDPKTVVYVTELALNRHTVTAADANPAAVPAGALIDLSQSRLGANNVILLYVHGNGGTLSVEIQLWMDIAAQGDPSKWIKIGASKTATGGAGEGELLRFDNVPSGLVAPQLKTVTASVSVEVFEQHSL